VFRLINYLNFHCFVLLETNIINQPSFGYEMKELLTFKNFLSLSEEVCFIISSNYIFLQKIQQIVVNITIMKTIQEAVESTIRKTPFIEEALNEKLINVSSLARVILPEVDKLLKKQVKVGAVMMAINRLSPASELRIRKNIRKFTLSLGDFIVRSDLSDYTYKNTKSLLKESARILTIAADKNDSFITVSRGIFETNIVISEPLRPYIDEFFIHEKLIHNAENLASITIKLPEGNLEQSGFYYFILKQLAWADIPLQEIISTTNEMTIVVKEKDINQTFAILMDMKK